MKEHDVTLELIAQAVKKLLDFTAGFDLKKFEEDSKTQSAVIMQLIVIGELVKKLPQEVQKDIDLPWRLMAGFRDMAVHEYFELDLEKVWDTINNDIPAVKQKLEQYKGKE